MPRRHCRLRTALAKLWSSSEAVRSLCQTDPHYATRLGVVELAALMLNFFDLYVASTVIHQNACSSLQTGHLGSLKPPRRLSSQHAVCSAQSCSGEDCSRKITTMSPQKPELLTLTPLLRRQGAN